jgi:hypothetical protein
LSENYRPLLMPKFGDSLPSRAGDIEKLSKAAYGAETFEQKQEIGGDQRKAGSAGKKAGSAKRNAK